ncbi:hypothetical protein [Priestia megaterium]|uniref:Uncharacterized protein n=1 Tax=Priestia megaterium TaxID=1404 RepID=A0A6M6EAC8_PRIMG|nr:hypothetical protein [Priestia megaterium]QJX80515.1 hypothetical protein FDZ14_30980 [Priestia megaterium]
MSINNQRQKVDNIVRLPNEIKTAFSGSEQIENMVFENARQTFFERVSAATSIQQIKDAQRWLNIQVASIDESVNTNIKFQTIPFKF